MRKLEHILPAWANQDLGSLGARLIGAFSGEGARNSNDGHSGEELALVISVSDVGYRLALLDRAGQVKAQAHRFLCVDRDGADPTHALAHAAASAPMGTPLLEENITSVLMLVDDPDLYLTDHRAAKLSNFEPRALRQFGVQQSGGRPVVFSSRPYGETGAKELERRAIAYLPEERMEALFFPLGAKATALKLVAPAGAPALDAGDEAAMSVRVHGYFSTITLYTPQSGVITSRQVPVGALTAASRYARAFGLPLDRACTALSERVRFAPVEAVLSPELPPEHRTLGLTALAPFQRELYSEVAATLEYYQFERYADRPAKLDLEFTGPPLAGLDQFLSDALGLPVDAREPVLDGAMESAHALNLLEGVRSGLLKAGNEPYQFENGAFRRADPPRNRRAANRRNGADQKTARAEEEGGLMSKFSALRKDSDGDDAPGRPAWIAPAFFVAAAAVLAVILNVNYVIGPAQKTLDRRSAAYGTLVAELSAQSDATETAGPTLAGARGASWAQNMVSIGGAMLPGMRLTGMTLNSGEDTNSGQRVLQLDGLLPEEAGGDLRLVAGFIDRLDKDSVFATAFPRVEFGGVGAPDEQDVAGARFTVLAIREDGE